MIRSLYLPTKGSLKTDLQSSEIDAALKNKRGLLWLNLVGEPPDMYRSILQDKLNFHRLAVESVLSQENNPRVDRWDQYILVILHDMIYTASDETLARVKQIEIDIFAGTNYIITLSKEPDETIENLMKVCLTDPQILKHGADHILYRLTDHLTHRAQILIDQMRDEIDLIQEQLFNKPGPATLEQIFAFKRNTLRLRRSLSAQRDVLFRLAHDDISLIDVSDRNYFRDVYSRLVRLDGINESLYDLTTGAFNTYLSVVNNRMNEAMRMLAVITTLFMPISFITGFFGMNFFAPSANLDFWTSFIIFSAALILMGIIPIGMYIWIRRHGWM